jgi:hypothetical protein
MNKTDSTLPHSRLREVLTYDSTTGRFTWLVKVTRYTCVGAYAGGVHSSGYVIVCVDGTLHRGHRLAWFWMTGKWPEGPIDHLNGIRHDNRFSNLREVTHQANTQNIRGAQVNNKTGYLGVCEHGSSWRAQIKLNGKRVVLGSFPSPYLAHEAYLAAKRAIHDGCTI